MHVKGDGGVVFQGLPFEESTWGSRGPRNDLEAIVASPNPTSVADELDKLAILMREGVITGAEFTRLKRRLAG